ncbi:MAG: hypothetical protein IIZ07_08825 [Ruminococcus sp.]|nr:hypothetical protein [Ruminococcus sp.]
MNNLSKKDYSPPRLTWYQCPNCRQRLFKVETTASIRGVEMKCKKCRQIIKVSL